MGVGFSNSAPFFVYGSDDMTKAQQVYELALALIDEVNEAGTVIPDNPEYYEKKSILYLNILQTELSKPADTIIPLTDLSQNVSVTDRVANLMLPYGLAAHLIMSENPTLASFLNARYEELKRKIPTASESITDVYDMMGCMQ